MSEKKKDYWTDEPTEICDQLDENTNHSKTNGENEPYYETSPDGTMYCCFGNNRIKVTEHFAENGKKIDVLIERAIRFAAGNGTPQKTSPIS